VWDAAVGFVCRTLGCGCARGSDRVGTVASVNQFMIVRAGSETVLFVLRVGMKGGVTASVTLPNPSLSTGGVEVEDLRRVVHRKTDRKVSQPRP